MAARKVEMHEDPQAWERFCKTMEAILSLRKKDLPPKGNTVKPKASPGSAPEK